MTYLGFLPRSRLLLARDAFINTNCSDVMLVTLGFKFTVP